MVDLELIAKIGVYGASLLMLAVGIADVILDFPMGIFEGIYYW